MKKQDSAPVSAKKAAPKKTTPMKTAEPAQAVSAPATVPAATGTASKEEFISQRAYYYYESRGCMGGQELDDWLKAEAEFEHMHTADAPTVEAAKPQSADKAAEPRRAATGTARRTGERKGAA